MPRLLSVAHMDPPYEVKQDSVVEFAREIFAESYRDIDRLLTVFQNGNIKSRRFSKDLTWFQTPHSLAEKNDAYLETAEKLGTMVVIKCLRESTFLQSPIPYEEIDAIFFVSTTGMATPSMEARIMNKLPFRQTTKRIPIWGLGCAGGTSGLARACEYCKAYPEAKVLLIALELCSLTFQKGDLSKSNLVGTSLFSDGVACVCIGGDGASTESVQPTYRIPSCVDAQSTLKPNSLGVMGWDVKDDGLYVVFSRDIPSIVKNWVQSNVVSFLEKNELTLDEVEYFIAHPGGKKVLDAYVDAFSIPDEKTSYSRDVLRDHGNMSSATVLYVLENVMKEAATGTKKEWGLMTSLGPGFSSELLLLKWEETV
ncbi:type III polyketide synthase [Bacillus fonticola]|uniref:type III polyketide synthase n=1 Tax=Bacillus fonticola TaxID=2728853 RepID=UPI0014735184|nr:3-oxoacyl-[acyl-carrier-protein] synthase III C-terminal domain-containing protein [Bacillus fonticola]